MPLAAGSPPLTLWPADSASEDPSYLSRQLITYIGNKRALLGHIGRAVDTVKRRLGKSRLRVFDAFSGSGVVSRFLKAHADFLVTNDIEQYAEVTSRCYLRNKNTVDLPYLADAAAHLNNTVLTAHLPPGFIEGLYSPRDATRITTVDRAFYTPSNARRLDNYRRLIDDLPIDVKEMLLGPLLSQASIRANTAGVFKGFYKDRRTRVGRFGGTGADALSRITGDIVLEPPVLSNFECECQIERGDTNTVAKRLRSLDLAYIDPPYNQHPYGSNYFMLDLIVRYERPERISRVSGIPTDWQRSGYNVRAKSMLLLADLLESLDAPFLLVSFNNEGFIAPEQMRRLLERLGSVRVIEVPYNAFRGSRNFKNRSVHVKEQLFLLVEV